MGPSAEDDSAALPPMGGCVVVEDAYRAHATMLRDIARSKFNVPPHDVIGVVNEVFTAFILRQNHVRNPRKWLIGAVCHASRAYWRSHTRESPLPTDVGDYVDPTTVDTEGIIVDRVTMASALRQVGPKCREVLRMYYAEGYSTAEIAARLNTTSGYVTQLLHTCRNRVRKAHCLAPEDAKG
ncbi:MAG TPA: sigma-70 family RNA polymerase sigma factor [Thermoanaerobaculia bacterium]|nr:sigma-70 family RNA polymerase sigma factor [Thermoanaerobaculia bacterium]